MCWLPAFPEPVSIQLPSSFLAGAPGPNLVPGMQARQDNYPGQAGYRRPCEMLKTCVVRLITPRRSMFDCQQDLRVGHARGRARHVPDQAVAYGGERSLVDTPTSRLTRTIVVKAVREKYS